MCSRMQRDALDRQDSQDLPAEAAAPVATGDAADVATAAPPPAGGGAVPQSVQQLMDITGATQAECVEALSACGDNVDAAAGMLMGL